MNNLFDKSEIQNKLKKLATEKPPENLAMGAMCYKVAYTNERSEYICIACNEKTIYPENYSRIIENEIPECRRIVNSIKSINIKLVEKEFCKKCSPEIENPSLKIEITYNQNDNHNTYVNSTNLTILKEFLDGKLTHTDKNDFESPLKNYLSEIQRITGVEIIIDK